MPGQWILTVRDGPHVTRMHFASAEQAIEALETHFDERAPETRRRAISLGPRRFDPSLQVVARAEIAGPGGLLSAPHAGVDMRGDGSVEAFTGRWRRRLLELESGESPYDGLRRALGGA